jgi:programmed cell death protein 5
MDDDLEVLRKKKLLELQQQMTSQKALEEQEASQEEFKQQKKSVLRYILTSGARERLTRIKIARPELGELIENQLIVLAQTGKLQNKINDQQFRRLLSQILPEKRDTKIRRG